MHAFANPVHVLQMRKVCFPNGNGQIRSVVLESPNRRPALFSDGFPAAGQQKTDLSGLVVLEIVKMINGKFKVAYLDRAMYPSFDESIRQSGIIELIRIDKSASEDMVRKLLSTCQGYYVMASRDELPKAFHVTQALLEFLPSLLVVASYGAGYDTIDVEACTRAGVAAVNQAGGNAQAVAEHAVGMAISLLKRVPEAQYAIRSGAAAERNNLMGRELCDKTVGVVGLGHTGSRTAAMVRGFGCRVLAFDPYLDDQECELRGARKVTLQKLLSESDAISVHCPLTEETRSMFSSDVFSQMKAGAIFVNTARGSTYDEAALADALASGHLGGAGLDVWEQEPPPKNHRLLTLPTVIATNHMAGVTHESRDRVARLAAESFINAAQGKIPERMINPNVLPTFQKRLIDWRSSVY